MEDRNFMAVLFARHQIRCHHDLHWYLLGFPMNYRNYSPYFLCMFLGCWASTANLLANCSSSSTSITSSIANSMRGKKKTGQDERLSRPRPWVPSQYDLISAALAASCSFVHCTGSVPGYDDCCLAELCCTHLFLFCLFYLIFFILSSIATCHFKNLGINVWIRVQTMRADWFSQFKTSISIMSLLFHSSRRVGDSNKRDLALTGEQRAAIKGEGNGRFLYSTYECLSLCLWVGVRVCACTWVCFCVCVCACSTMVFKAEKSSGRKGDW